MRNRSTFERILSGLRDVRLHKVLAARVIRDGSLPTRPGLWLLGPSFSTRLGTRMPPPLDRVKRWFDFDPYGIMKYFVRLAGVLVPPWFTWTTARGINSYAATAVLVNRSETPICFDWKAGLAIRRMDARAEAHIRSAAQIASTYPCPDTRRDSAGQLLLQTFVSGVAYRYADDTRRDACMATILRSLRSAPRLEMSVHARRKWLAASQLLLSSVGLAGGARAAALIEGAHAAMIHGDLTGENIIVAEDGFSVLDFERVMVGPLFYDPLCLWMSEARRGRGQQLDAFLAGDHDADFRALGVQFADDASATSHTTTAIAAIAWPLSKGLMTEAHALRLSRQVDEWGRSVVARSDRASRLTELQNG